jgi:hypothetical protein
MTTKSKLVPVRKRIVQLDRMRNSVNGNPRFRVHFSDGTSAPTSVDAGCAYGIENRENRENDVMVHFSGRGTIDYVKPVID